jgi:hypothetical protein
MTREGTTPARQDAEPGFHNAERDANDEQKAQHEIHYRRIASA